MPSLPPLRLFVETLVDLGDFVTPELSLTVFQLHDFLVGPMKVKG
jgi:hypothetical protein